MAQMSMPSPVIVTTTLTAFRQSLNFTRVIDQVWHDVNAEVAFFAAVAALRTNLVCITTFPSTNHQNTL